MKKILFSFLAGITLISVLPSCTNLEEDVYDKLPADSFGSSEIEVKALVGTVHNTLRRYWQSNTWFTLNEAGGSSTVTPTRIGGDWYDGGQYREIFMHTWTAQTSAVKSAWSVASEAIGTCNATISVLQGSEFLTDAQKTENIADVRGVRAFWIYTMMDGFGNIPLVTDYADKELPSVRPRQEVYNWLVQEVSEIAEQCPAGTYDNYGKFTKGAAYFLLAKLYLNAEAWGVTATGNAYGACIDACDKVLAMGYTLEPDYKTNFGVNDQSREGVLSAVFDESDTQNTLVLMCLTLHYADNASDASKYSAWNGVCAQPDFVRLFDVGDLDLDATNVADKLYSSDFNGDPRFPATYRIGLRRSAATGEILQTGQNQDLNYTVAIPFIPGTERDGTPWSEVYQYTGARCQKWPYSTSLTSAMGNDFHIFRLADVYLMKAEAILRSGGDVAEATKLVNTIRQRAYGDDKHNKTTVTLKDVQLERRFELAWECWSRQDDIRFGEFEKSFWSSSNCDIAKGDYLKIYPISQDAFQTNQKLVQNPGYPAFQ
ncbi:MAG: RagB/SusD family nutrient uptake outer membrane protein [Tannerella sp.]|jgi:hypothetical protein|nr:RagB/SusD family nutrient uptake outer membrane protein [Tannerella sp.]